MGKRGPKPKPTILKVLSGNPGKRPLTPDIQPVGIAVMPDGLGEHGTKAWRELETVLTPLGLLTPADVGMAFLYCQAWDDYHRAASRIAKEGYVARWLKIRNAAIERIRRLSGEFGLSPASRVGLHVTQAPADTLDEYKVG